MTLAVLTDDIDWRPTHSVRAAQILAARLDFLRVDCWTTGTDKRLWSRIPIRLPRLYWLICRRLATAVRQARQQYEVQLIKGLYDRHWTA